MREVMGIHTNSIKISVIEEGGKYKLLVFKHDDEPVHHEEHSDFTTASQRFTELALTVRR